ncbi:glomulin [Fopius arisanus]|uniref:Glomulin n=1 Tax=Fopius arisanus TaxID=64838 RepID=A0A9R1TQB2_9HYME|nr:PREDICTED: glomulin [Fopius arisanus]
MSTENSRLSDPSEDFSNKVKDLLTSYETAKLSILFKTDGTDEILDRSSWSLVPMICTHLTDENKKTRNSFFLTCEELLQIFADRCNPSETVLLFLEQAESLPDDVRFCALLKPLEISLKRGDMSKSIEWVVSTIRAYAEDLPLPENTNPEAVSPGDEEDPVIDRLTTTLRSILDFLSPLIEIALDRVNSDPREVKVLMNLINIHLNLFSKPFSHLDINPEDSSSVFRVMTSQILRLETNPIKFFEIIENRIHKRINKLDPEPKIDLYNLQVQLFDMEVSDLTYANFFFTLMMSLESCQQLPQVYHPLYIMNCCIYLGNHLLKQPEYVLVTRGLRFLEGILNRVPEESIQPEALQLAIHGDLFSSISQVMIYCDSSRERQLALGVFQGYIRRFSMAGRYRVLWMLYDRTKHSGLLALIINIFKSSIIISLDRGDKEFLRKLEPIFKRIFRLPHGSVSDLVEMSDEIIAALNLLRFLVIRDTNNSTGIWKVLKSIQGYLKELRDGVDLARAHWKVKLRDLQEENGKRRRIETQVSVVVGGQELPDMPVREKIKFCYQAINALDVIESIVVRVNECIDTNPMKKLTIIS